MKTLLVVGGGVVGWATAALIAKRHNDIKVTLIESPQVPILGVGESTLPYLGDLFNWLEIDEKTWMQETNAIYKLGNYFIGWNSESPKKHVTDHWNAPSWERQFNHFTLSYNTNTFKKSFFNPIEADDYFYCNNGSPGVDNKNYDYWLELVKRGKYAWHEAAAYMSDTYYFAINNKSPYDNNGDLLTGNVQRRQYMAPHSYAWHVDAEKFPTIIRDKVAIPNNVEWIKGHIQNIRLDDKQNIKSVHLTDGKVLQADLYADCSGFTRLLMKNMPTKWHTCQHVPTQSSWVAPVKYKDPYLEMKPYTQSYCQDNGWNFIIPLYSRMGSGYIFDEDCEDKDTAREKFIQYWDGYEFIKEPRYISWDSGWYEEAFINNVVGVGMGQGFVDPMEANSIHIAQICIQMLDRIIGKYKDRDIIPSSAKKGYTRQVQKLEKQVADFISYHFTLSKRTDHNIWKKWSEYGRIHNHKEKNWAGYRDPIGYNATNIFTDVQWAQQQLYFRQWDNELCALDIDEKLLPLAEANFINTKQKSKALADYAPNIYDWCKTNLYNNKSHEVVLNENLH